MEENREQVTREGEGALGEPAPKKLEPGTAKVRIRRVTGVDPITAFSYTPFRTPEMDLQAHSSGMKDFHPDPNQDTFEVSADIAAAAVETGGFEVDASSRVRLKGHAPGVEGSVEGSSKGGE